MKKLFGIVLLCLLAFVFASLYYYNKWKHLWSLEEPKKMYLVSHHKDDTLRIVMIGDSWVGMRTRELDSLFQSKLSEMIGRPVMLWTKGKGGAKSRGVYKLMFEDDGFGTKPLLVEGANYCVVIAGINDAANNLGKKQYVYHIKLIIDFMLANNIRPVLVEIPDVKIWHIYGGKPIKDLAIDYVRSLMTSSGMYHFSEYREALLSMLKDSCLIDSILYVPMRCWNGDNGSLNKKLFLDDQIHLNQQGYNKLDSCIANAIRRDLK